MEIEKAKTYPKTAEELLVKEYLELKEEHIKVLNGENLPEQAKRLRSEVECLSAFIRKRFSVQWFIGENRIDILEITDKYLKKEGQ